MLWQKSWRLSTALRRGGSDMKLGDIIITIMAITIVIMMIIPLPAALMDLLLVFNITFSMIILLISMNMEKPLDFSIFPSLLLITTMSAFTQHIIHQANFNKWICRESHKSFGNFVVKGNPLVGFIIFMIIVIIQFLSDYERC